MIIMRFITGAKAMIPEIPDTQAALVLVKEIGFPSLLFFVWYIYHKAESAKWTTYLHQVREENGKQFELFQNIIDQGERAREQQFVLLKETIETVNFHSNMLGRIEQKIDTSQYCPLVRKEQNKS